ncbi:MAG TPA: hypothetical protein VE733_05565 [Streptosporangiaceae bacterium]|jgi:ABC-2 type transport system permease protein|nr:hypothetical protein [Streptosporangiaceae bacterium]
MSPWRLEALRLWRTRRLAALAAVYVILGLGIPVLTYELPQLLKHTSGGVRVIAPPPTPVSSLTGFASNAAQLGTLVLVVVAAASLAIDARPALAAFYRSRTRRPSRLLLPRTAVLALAGAACVAAGTGCCWYETDVLIGPLSVAALSGGFGLEILWVCFCVAVVAVWAGLVRSVLAVAGAALATLLVLAFISSIHPVAPWLPTKLAASLASLAGPHPPGAPWRALAITAVATAGLLAAAGFRVQHRAD